MIQKYSIRSRIPGKLFNKVRGKYDKKEFKKAAEQFLTLLGILNVSLEDVLEKEGKKALIPGGGGTVDGKWLDELIDYCRENGLIVPESADNSIVLQQAIDNQFPKENHLIITTDLVDKRRALYKTINKVGIVIDCSVPKGNRRADQMAQETGFKRESAGTD